MKKENLADIINDLRARRDCLSLAHESVKSRSDSYNKLIIVLSLITGAIESIKIQLKLDTAAFALLPIFMSSIIGMISALAKFEDFGNRMEVLVQAISLLTNVLLKCRNKDELDDELLNEYHTALQSNETSLYPDIRKKYLKNAHKNLLCIMKQEQKYYENINRVNNGEKIIISDSKSDTTTNDNELDISIHPTKSIISKSTSSTTSPIVNAFGVKQYNDEI